MRLYLDIDGVLLHQDGRVPEGAMEFLAWAVVHFECHWLTTHCKGDSMTALRYLGRHYPAEAMPSFEQIQATDWDAMKTEGIDFSQPFFWMEDQPFQAEMATLNQHGCSDSLIHIDLRREGELQRVKSKMIDRIQS